MRLCLKISLFTTKNLMFLIIFYSACNEGCRTDLQQTWNIRRILNYKSLARKNQPNLNIIIRITINFFSSIKTNFKIKLKI